jgi:hypothetical protein
MIKGEFLVRIKNAWPNEISGDDKKRFYCPVPDFALN